MVNASVAIIMVSMARGDTQLRLFVAIYPPAVHVEQWLEQLQMLNLPPHRATPNEQVHMTVQFIGDCAVRDLAKTIESVERSARGLKQFRLQPCEMIVLPERGPARLIAVETDAPATLLELQRRLAVRLARNVRANPSKRFRPHLTLCRFRSPVKLKTELPASDATASFDVHELRVMKSTLQPGGAQHDLVQAVPL